MKTQVQELRVEVKDFGSAVGTTGWFKNFLQDAKILLTKTKDSLPCVAIKTEKESVAIAFVSPSDTEYVYGLKDCGDSIYCIYAEASSDENGFVSYATPAAYKLIDNFIWQCVELLRDSLNADEADYEIVIVKK